MSEFTDIWADDGEREKMFNELQAEQNKRWLNILGIMLVYPASEWESHAKDEWTRDFFRRRRAD